MKKNKILLLGWDAADWKIIDKLIAESKMPALQRLIQKGVRGNLKTIDPPLSPMLWTSIATGFRADKHGISGFIEPTTTGDGLRPVTSTSRKVKAIWNIYNQEGWKSNVVGWWPSNPVEPINGVMVSNFFQVANKPISEPWIMQKGTIHPENLEETLKEFRVHPHEITVPMVAPFIPNIMSDVELRSNKKTIGVIKTIANSASIHAASTYLIQETEWDFMAIYHDAIDHFCHIGMKFNAPKREQIKQEDFDNFNGIVEAGYRYHDLMLHRILDIIDENTTLLLISDHGFYSDHQRPLHIPHEPSGPAVEHSPYGIFLMVGPGIKQNQKISGASILDITPTLLYHSGLPVGKDMEGKILYQCFDNPNEAKFIPSWEEKIGNSGQHNEEIREDPWAAQEAMNQLVELGYIDAPNEDISNQIIASKRESQYYIARNLINGGKVLEAIEILEKIYAESKTHRYGQRLAMCYLSKRRYKQCIDLIEDIKNSKQKKQEEYPVNIEEPMYLEYLYGLYYLAVNKLQKALPILEEILAQNPNNFHILLNIALIYLERKKYIQSEKFFIKCLAIDDQNTVAHHGLGISFLRQNKYEEAIDEFLLTIETNFYFPKAHYHLGETLFKMNDFEDATKAFEVAIKIAPNMIKPHEWLFTIYSEKIINRELAERSRNFLSKNKKGKIIVFNGLEGIDYSPYLKILNDYKIKIIDKAELDVRVKKALNQVDDLITAVFVPSHLLHFLPTFYQYQFVELLLPEKIILEKLNQVNNKKRSINLNQINELNRIYELKNTWLESNPTVKYYSLNCDELILNHLEELPRLKEFLDIFLKFKEIN
jgi:predicted AlkP superfamily phosphohydrolase/phosphomutase/tetratricopeptide (TPR) repeat protein